MGIKYFIKTFGCAQNESDSERIASMLQSGGMEETKNINEAEHVIINTCMIREKAENRVYGTVYNLSQKRLSTGLPKKIIITGCMVGMAVRDKTGKFLKLIKKRIPEADEFLPIEEVGFDNHPIHKDATSAWVPITNGCNNFCTFCVVPFTRGREISRPYEEVMDECSQFARKGYKKITLLGMNVNSYGADLVVGADNIQVLRDINKRYFQENSALHHSNPDSVSKVNSNASLKLERENSKLQYYCLPNGKKVKPIFVKHLNRLRIPTLFPYLLDEVCKIEGIENVDFISSNPWDFSRELIETVAKNPKITRNIHLPVQSGSNTVLKRMNRWYTAKQYLALISKLRKEINNLKISTDVIVGFCGETEKEFMETVDLVKKAHFYKAYISMYSDRPGTAAHKVLKDNIPHKEKKKRWKILEEMINLPNLDLMRE